MKIYIWAITCFIFGGIFTSFIAANTPLEQIVDLGTGAMGEKKTATIELPNPLSKTVTIKSIQTSCGCTTAKVDKMEVNPGESLHLRIEVDSEGHDGPLEQTIAVLTDDPQHQIYGFVRVKGNFRASDQDLLFNSLYINAGLLEVGDEVVRVIQVTKRGHANVGKLQVISSSPTVSIKEVQTTNSSARIVVCISSDFKSGSFEHEIIVNEIGGKETTTIKVVGENLPLVELIPNIQAVRQSQSTYVLPIRNRTGKKLRLSSYNFAGHGISVNSCTLSEQNDQSITFDITIAPDAPSLPGGILTVKFNDVQDQLTLKLVCDPR